MFTVIRMVYLFDCLLSISISPNASYYRHAELCKWKWMVQHRVKDDDDADTLFLVQDHHHVDDDDDSGIGHHLLHDGFLCSAHGRAYSSRNNGCYYC